MPAGSQLGGLMLLYKLGKQKRRSDPRAGEGGGGGGMWEMHHRLNTR